MAVETAGGVKAGIDEVLDCYAGTSRRLAGRVVTLVAVIFMQAEDAGPGVDELAVAGVAVLPLGLIDAISLADRMGMVVAGKGAGVAGAAFAGSIDG